MEGIRRIWYFLDLNFLVGKHRDTGVRTAAGEQIVA